LATKAVTSSPGECLWRPTAARERESQVTHFMTWLREANAGDFRTYDDLWLWSTTELETFWSCVWRYFGLDTTCTPYANVLRGTAMPDVQWFTGATTNYARHALLHDPNATAIEFEGETGRAGRLTYGDLTAQVGAISEWLRRSGVGPGDCVVGYLPNVPESVVAFLATAAIGATWASCSPDLGIPSAIDRFAQIKPKALVAVDGYIYAGRRYDRTAEVRELRAALPSLAATLQVRHIAADRAADAEDWSEVVAETAGGPPEFQEVAWDHPLWVLFTSGTTGLPKPIVHGHGGILIEHLKTHAFHLDIDAQDTFFWYTSTNWMMWNFLVSGLLRGAAIVLYDGSPAYPSPARLWELAAAHEVTFLGTSAPFIELCMKAHLRPAHEFDLQSIESIGSTASPLTAEGFRWLYEELGGTVLVGSTSGGTDVCTPFVGSSPLLPVYAGEIQCRLLGAAVDVFDEAGASVRGTVGELVVTKPMPSMPLFFWNDPSKQQYRETYFDAYPDVWRHGDWATITSRGTVIIHGRSDSTIKRGGIRTGTSEFYRVLDRLEPIADSLVIDTTAFAAGGRSEIVLFAVLAGGHVLDENTEAAVRGSLRSQLSPRHVPDRIFAVPAIPRTLNGKKLEVPVKRILEGQPLHLAAAAGSIDDPESLAYLTALLPDRGS
jgi:acetoacetyl-CoA synthetase